MFCFFITKMNKMKHVSVISAIFRRKFKNNFYFSAHHRHLCSQTSSEKSNRMEALFLNKDVQRILKKITAPNYDKIFAPSKTQIADPEYLFVTDEQLKELQERAALRAEEKLQMPPVMEIREPIDEVLARDPDLQGYLKSKTVFMDISANLSNRDRMITVREEDGTLRKAFWEERERMIQIFFPMPGKNLERPKLFESSNLQRLLDSGEYEFVLDCACVQFEPDAPEFHEATSETYEHVRKMKKFDSLRSTRHFGPMAFYFAYKKNIDPLLHDMISRQMLSDASDTIKLYYILHPELKISQDVDAENSLAVVQDYIKNNSTLQDDLEMALQTYVEQCQSKVDEVAQ